jgi:hypothetical protein
MLVPPGGDWDKKLITYPLNSAEKRIKLLLNLVKGLFLSFGC